MNKQFKTFMLEQGPRGLAYGLFWSWNAIFLTFMFLGFAPIILPEVLTGVRSGTIPAQYLAYGIILTAIPASGYRFDRWSGDVSGNVTSVPITMNASKSVIATFIKSTP